MKTIAKRILHRLYRLLTPGSSRTQTMNALASLNATVTALKDELAAIKAELADVRQKMSAPPLPLADSLGAIEEKKLTPPLPLPCSKGGEHHAEKLNWCIPVSAAIVSLRGCGHLLR